MRELVDIGWIKAAAQKLGRPVRSLIALADQTDPFYMAPARIRGAEWVAELWDTYRFKRGYHIRRMHYVLVSQSPLPAMPDGSPYWNSKECYQTLGRCVADARHMGLIPADALVD